jgi:ubiquinone/menaquinone biosynthesis C-methylase UbiE
MANYPAGAHVVAFDIAEKMVEGARRRSRETGVSVEVLTADVQALPFDDDSFDAAVATLVFCSVPDPVLGLRELRRVLVPGGQLFLLEHVLSRKLLLRSLMHLLNPLFRLFGDNINRKTVEHVDQAGFVDIEVDELGLDVVKSIDANRS